MEKKSNETLSETSKNIDKTQKILDENRIEKSSNLDIGKRIRMIRVEHGETMEEFGKRFSPAATKGTISKWESGKYLPNNERLKELADIGNISITYLLQGRKMLSDLSKEEIEKINRDIDESRSRRKKIIKNLTLSNLDKIKSNLDLDELNSTELNFIRNSFIFMNHLDNPLFHDINLLLVRLNITLNELEYIEEFTPAEIERKKESIKLHFDDLIKEFPNVLNEGKEELLSRLK